MADPSAAVKTGFVDKVPLVYGTVCYAVGSEASIPPSDGDSATETDGELQQQQVDSAIRQLTGLPPVRPVPINPLTGDILDDWDPQQGLALEPLGLALRSGMRLGYKGLATAAELLFQPIPRPGQLQTAESELEADGDPTRAIVRSAAAWASK